VPGFRSPPPVLVLGLGSSGAAAARLLLAEGRAVTAIDAAAGPKQEEAAGALRAAGAEVRLGAPRDVAPAGAWDLVVASPGVPPSSPWIAGPVAAGVPVVSELELGWSRRGAARAVAITGSNGKSTAVKWLAESLACAGLRAAIAGNYGPPACAVVRERGAIDWLVLEVSSFQLETCRDFRPDVGVILNVQPNHLDRHGSFDAYRAAKARLFANARADDVCLVPFVQAGALRGAAGGHGRWVTFGAEPAADVRFAGGSVHRRGAAVASVRGTYFDNAILGLAAAAVTAAAEACGAPAEAVERAARAYEPLAHRLQPVATVAGVRYIDDSKATSMTSMMAAVRMTPGPVRLIAGGRAKESDFSAAKELLASRAAKVYLIGESAQVLNAAWAASVPCERFGTLDAALDAARREARPGDAVLLSPACTSFDQYGSFGERGEAFVRRVRTLESADGDDSPERTGAVR